MPETIYCNACGAPVYFVVSHNGRRFTVDTEPVANGSFELDGNLAKYFPATFNPTGEKRYQPHKLSCKGKGKKAQTEALQRTLARAREGL